jgi:hypothetical protein
VAVFPRTRLNPFGRHAWGVAPWGPSPFEVEEAAEVAASPVEPNLEHGFDEYMKAFARERHLERLRREDEEILMIAAFEDDIIAKMLGLH